MDNTVQSPDASVLLPTSTIVDDAAKPEASTVVTTTFIVPPTPPTAVGVSLGLSVAPGSAGLAVAELAQLLETLGIETYLSQGVNADNVMTDELMSAVRRALSNYHSTSADPVELPQLLRDVAQIDAVHGDTWKILRDQAAAA